MDLLDTLFSVCLLVIKVGCRLVDLLLPGLDLCEQTLCLAGPLLRRGQGVIGFPFGSSVQGLGLCLDLFCLDACRAEEVGCLFLGQSLDLFCLGVGTTDHLLGSRLGIVDRVPCQRLDVVICVLEFVVG